MNRRQRRQAGHRGPRGASAWPSPPFTMFEFATLTRELLDHPNLANFPEEIRAREWGMLYCEDARRAHWTLLGDLAFAQALRAAERPVEPVPGYDHGEGWNGRGVAAVTMEDFPLSELRPTWALQGWPDEWPRMAEMEILAPSALLTLINGYAA